MFVDLITSIVNSYDEFADRHPEAVFVLNILFMLFLLFVAGGKTIQFILALIISAYGGSVVAIIYYKWARNKGTVWELMKEHLTIFGAPMLDKGGRLFRDGPCTTYLLIFANVAIFYHLQTEQFLPAIINNFIFLPRNALSPWLPVSIITSVFLHGSDAHLWGNMMFLWAMGVAVEHKLGHWRFLWCYLLCGVAANYLGFVFHAVLMGETLHGLGASGAIAGMMAMAGVLCYYKPMTIPVPVFGPLAVVMGPFGLICAKIRINTLLLMGMFFLMDYSAGVKEAAGTEWSMIGHWVHVGGMLTGFYLARTMGMFNEAIRHRHRDKLESAFVDDYLKPENMFKDVEKSANALLTFDPEDPMALLMLARLRVQEKCSAHPYLIMAQKYGKTESVYGEEAKELYRKAITLLMTKDRALACEVFRTEYYKRFFDGISPSVNVRLADMLRRQDDTYTATRLLEMVIDDSEAAPRDREQALALFGYITDGLGAVNDMTKAYKQLLDEFPSSQYADRAKARLAACYGL